MSHVIWSEHHYLFYWFCVYKKKVQLYTYNEYLPKENEGDEMIKTIQVELVSMRSVCVGGGGEEGEEGGHIKSVDYPMKRLISWDRLSHCVCQATLELY